MVAQPAIIFIEFLQMFKIANYARGLVQKLHKNYYKLKHKIHVTYPRDEIPNIKFLIK